LLSRTTYFFTDTALNAMIASIADAMANSESRRPFKLIDLGH
jgi:hypothetical protein